jgi:hypothetical protein
MATMRHHHHSGVSTYAPYTPPPFHLSGFPASRGTTALPPKRKLREHQERDADDRSPLARPHTRVVVDEFGNRVLVDGLKRMRVSSPPKTPTPTVNNDVHDIAMDDDTESDSDATSIVPLRMAKHKTPTLVPSAQQAMQQFTAVETPAWSGAYDPSCRAMVLFDPHQRLTVERSPRIQLVHSDSEKTESSESDLEEQEPFVRFEELPDDYEEEPEAMEVD